jgi:hypothetical protein
LVTKSTSTSALWAEKKNASKPIDAADIRDIKKKFGIGGRVHAVAWAGHYAVSDCGRLFSNCPVLTGAGGVREITLSVDKESGYRFAYIYRDGRKRKHVRVHKLVAEAFVPNPDGHRLVRHFDDDPANNRAANLMWGSSKDNADDARRNGRLRTGSRSPQAKATEHQIAAIRLARAAGLPTATLTAELGYSPSRGLAVACGSGWSAVPTGEQLLAVVNAMIAERAAPAEAATAA